MAEKILNTRIQLKYDTFANWGTHSTVVLKQGEMGICYVPAGTSGLTTSDPAVMFKVGDGVTTFANLPWASGLATDVPDWAKSSTPVVDTNTKYQLVQDATDGHKFSLQSQEKGSSTWNTVTTITIPDNNTSDTNQTIKVGTTTFGADDVVELKAGTNVTLTPDANGKKITITATDTNTTYTFAEGSTNGAFSVTPSGGSAQSVSVHGLGSAAYTASTDYATSAQGTKADNAMPKAGGTFTGEVVLAADPTKNLGAATKQYVDTKVSGLVDSAPNTLDTLNELAAALGDDPNFATTIAGQIGGKVDKVTGKGLSTEDYTTTEKEKLSGIATGATKVESSTTNGKIKINGTETTVYTEVANTVHDANYVHTDSNYTSAEKTKLAGIAEGANNYTHPGTGTNPHGTTKSDVGLENVGNFKAVSTVASQGLTETEKSNARANIGAGTSSLTIGTTSSTAAAGDHTHSQYLTEHQSLSAYSTTSQMNSAIADHHDSTKYDASNPNGYTSNAGTITGITMNGSSKGTSGVVDLGTVLTSHQSLSSCLKNNANGTLTGNASDTPLYLKSNASSTYLGFKDSGGTTLGFYGVNASKKPVFYDSSDVEISLAGHTHTAANISAGTLGGQVNANTSAVSSLGTSQVRNITISTSEPTSTQGNNGDIWFVYE